MHWIMLRFMGLVMNAYTKLSTWPSANANVSSLTSGLTRSIHCYLDGSVVCGYLWWICEDRDSQREAFPCKRKKSYWAYVLRKGRLLISNSTWTHQMALKHFSCLYLKMDICPGSWVYNLTTTRCWMHSLCGNCSKLLEKKINLYLNDLHFVCKKRRLPLTGRVYLIYMTAGTLSVLSKGS